MQKKLMKRSLALGALMAFVITGSAMAANVDVAEGDTKDDEKVITVGTNEKFNNAGTVIAEESITVNGGYFNNTGTVETGVLDIYGHVSDQKTISGVINVDKFIYRGIAGDLFGRGLEADIAANELHIIGTKTQTGFLVKDNNVLDNVDNIIIETDNISGCRTGITFEGDLHIESSITLKGNVIKGDASRLEVNNDSHIVFDTVTNESNKGKIQTNDNSMVTVNELNVKSGELSLQTYGVNTATGEFELHKVNLGDNAKLRASVYQGITPNAKITGDIDITLGKGALVDFGGMKNADWNGDRINVAADSLTIRVEDTSKSTTSSNRVYISSNSDIVKNNADKIIIIADGKNNSGNAVEDLKNAGDVLQFTTETDSDTTKPTVSSGVGATVEQEAGAIFDGASGTIAADGSIKDIKVDANTNVYGILDITSNALMAWRQENDDMYKRLGELRDSNGEHGVWVRMVRGQVDYNSIENQYNTYQLGFDKQVSDDWTVGAAMSYTDGSGTFASGSGENTHKSIAFYGSKLNEDGSFVDLIAKYGRLEHEFDVAKDTLSGEYDTNGYSFSVEYGKRYEKENGLWIEPQVQLTYGKVDDADYVNAQGNKVAQDDMDSFVGRIGFRVGKDIKQGNVYARASYLYDFEGETAVRFTDSEGHNRNMEADLGGGWFEVGVGTNINLSDATYVYFDVEKTYGGDVATPWQWNAGVRYSF